jgi:hypothetical protein
MSIVETYWSGVSRRLQEEVDTFNKLIGHAGEQGKENEQSLVRLMERLLPRSLGIGSGVVIDADGSRSKQADIVIYDSINQPTILAQTSQMLFPVENVFMVIEVKTTLGDEEIEDCAEKKLALDNLAPRGDRPPPAFCVLAYHAEASSAKTLATNVRKVDEAGRPDLLCVIFSATLAGKKVHLDANSTDDYQAGIAALHQRDSSGERISLEWDRPKENENGAYVLRNGLRHPVARAGRKKEERLVGEPGRALLNFSSLILDILADRNAIPESFLKHYLQHSARELVTL